MSRHLFVPIANLSAILLLVALIAAPIYFAKNFSKVAGAKNEAKYLIISQVEKFPQMKLVQEEDSYQLIFAKQSESQAYLGVLILDNPTNSTKTYALETASVDSKPFFGQNQDNQLTRISLPASASIPISIISQGESQQAEFKITADNE